MPQHEQSRRDYRKQTRNRTTPSNVALIEMSRLSGQCGEPDHANIKNTVFDAKRLIGVRLSDHVVREDMKHRSFGDIWDDGDNHRFDPARCDEIVHVGYFREC